MSRGIFSTEEAHDKAGIHVVVEEAGEECSLFLWVDLRLQGPIWIRCFDPPAVVIGEVKNCLMELSERGSCHGKAGDIVWHEEA